MTFSENSRDSRLHGIEFAKSAHWALRGAFQLVGRGPVTHVGTQHLLLSLILRVFGLRLSIGSKVRKLKVCVKDSDWEASGPGAAIDPAVPTGIVSEADASLREAQWQVRGFDRNNPHSPFWTPSLRAALIQALLITQSQGCGLVTVSGLLHGLFRDTRNGASVVLAQLGVSRNTLLNAVAKTPASDRDNELWAPIADTLREYGIVLVQGNSVSASLPSRVIRRLAARAADVSSIFIELEFEAVRQTIRLGYRQVSTAHLLLAILEFDRQLSGVGLSLLGGDLQRNRAGVVLCGHGITGDAVVGCMPPAEHVGEAAPPCRRRELRVKRNQPEWTRAAAEAVDESRLVAKQGDEDAGSLHLLFALLQDPSNLSSAIMRTIGVNLAVLRSDTERLLRDARQIG